MGKDKKIISDKINFDVLCLTPQNILPKNVLEEFLIVRNYETINIKAKTSSKIL